MIAESGNTRVILATWPPGKRDEWHSHPAGTGVYVLNDCESRVYTPDGKFVDNSRKAGAALINAAIPSHSFENRGTTDCRIVLVERE